MEDSTARDFFYPLNGTEHGSQQPLTTCDRELVSVLGFRIKPDDLIPRPLTPQSITLPTQPRAGSVEIVIGPLYGRCVCGDADTLFKLYIHENNIGSK